MRAPAAIVEKTSEHAAFLAYLLDTSCLVAAHGTRLFWFDVERHGSPRAQDCPTRDVSSSSLSSSSPQHMRPVSGSLERGAGDGPWPDAPGLKLIGRLACDLVTAQPPAENEAFGEDESAPLLRWLLALPSADPWRFEWLERLESLVEIDRSIYHRIASALAREVAQAPQLVALYCFASRRKITKASGFKQHFMCAVERVAEFADPCDTAGLEEKLAEAGMPTEWPHEAIEDSSPLEFRHLARALVRGGRADSALLALMPTATVLDATRAALDFRGHVGRLVLASSPLAPPLVELVCELLFTLPELAAEALAVPPQIDEPRRKSAYPPQSFVEGDGFDALRLVQRDDGSAAIEYDGATATFAYPDGAACEVRLTIAADGQETFSHTRLTGSAVSTVQIVVHSAEQTISHPLASWASEHGPIIRDHLDSLFDDTRDNRTSLVEYRLRRCMVGDWATAFRCAEHLIVRFGTDDVAGAASAIVHYPGDLKGAANQMLAAVLALGVSPASSQFDALSWRLVRGAFARGRRQPPASD